MIVHRQIGRRGRARSLGRRLGAPAAFPWGVGNGRTISPDQISWGKFPWGVNNPRSSGPTGLGCAGGCNGGCAGCRGGATKVAIAGLGDDGGAPDLSQMVTVNYGADSLYYNPGSSAFYDSGGNLLSPAQVAQYGNPIGVTQGIGTQPSALAGSIAGIPTTYLLGGLGLLILIPLLKSRR